MNARLSCLIVSLTLTLPSVALADYVAMSVHEGQRAPLPENVDDIEAKYLLNVEWGEYNGRRARLGVLEVDNKSTASSFVITSSMGTVDYSSSSTGVPVNGIESIVMDVLNHTGRFRLVERKVLGDVLQEQDLAASGRVSGPSGAATGKILGAEYLVQVVVTDYQPDTEGKDIGVGGLLRNKVPLLGGVKVKNRQSRVGMNFRLIDAETSEVVFTKQVESIIKESGLAFGGVGFADDVALGGFMSSFSKTPIGQAVIAGINEGVFELIKQVGAQPAQGSVVKADANQIWINIGGDRVNVGERLKVMAKGEELIDPETGISLGGADTYLGDLEVTQVHEKYSIGRPINLASEPNRGDKVVSTSSPEALTFATAWAPPN